MNARLFGAALFAAALALAPAHAGGLAAPEVESEVFGAEEPAVAAGGLGGTRTIAIIAALVLVAAVAGGGGGDDDDGDGGGGGGDPDLN
jgi:hypothetical protein